MKKRFQLILLLFVFAVITYLDRNSISSLEKYIIGDLGLTDIEWGYILSAFSLAYGLFEIPTGILVDKFGPRVTLFRIIVLWSIFTILTGWASGFYFLIIVRFLFGAGEAGAFPTASVIITRWFPVVERGRVQSMMWMGTRLGGALAPILSLWLADLFGWRSVFFIFGSLGIIWATVWYFWFRDEPSDIKNITSEEVAIINAGRNLKKSKHTLLPLRIIAKNGNLWALMGMYHCLLYGAYFYMSWMPKYLRNGRGITDEDLGWMTSLPFVFGMGGCLAGGFVSDYLVKKKGLTFGRRYVGMFGLVMAGILMIVGTYAENNTLAIILLGLGLAFKDFTLPVAWAVASEIGGKHGGAVSGTMGMAGQLGSVVMAIAFGYILTATNSYEIPVRLIGCVVVLGGFLWLKIDANKPILDDRELETVQE
jgi:ACS family glucarate transporter-like MFS transporter